MQAQMSQPALLHAYRKELRHKQESKFKGFLGMHNAGPPLDQ